MEHCLILLEAFNVRSMVILYTFRDLGAAWADPHITSEQGEPKKKDTNIFSILFEVIFCQPDIVTEKFKLKITSQTTLRNHSIYGYGYHC